MSENGSPPRAADPPTEDGKNECAEQKSNFPKKNAQYCGTGKLACPDLGEDWYFEQVVRQQGKSAGNYDTYYFSPSGVRIRSKLKLQEYVGKDLSEFDFNAGEYKKEQQDANKRKKCSLKKKHLRTVQPRAHSSVRKDTKAISNASLKSRQRRRRQGFPPKKRFYKDLQVANKKRGVRDASNGSDVADTYEFFRKEAMPHAMELLANPSDADDLISCAWEFLSQESKNQLEKAFLLNRTAEGSLDTSNASESSFEIPESQNQDAEHVRPFIPLKSILPRRKGRGQDGSKPRRCGVCNSRLARNRSSCVHCRDMKKSGGAGNKKKSCIQLKCEAVHSPITPKPTLIHDEFSSSSSPFSHESTTLLDQSNSFWNDKPTSQEFPSLTSSSSICDEETEEQSSLVANEEVSNSSMPGNGFGVESLIEREGSVTGGCDYFEGAESPPFLNSAVEHNSNKLKNQPSASNQASNHKPHRRKSRIPMCIKQDGVTLESATVERDDDANQKMLMQ